MSVNPPPIKVQWPVLPSSLMYPRIILMGSPWSAPTPQPKASKIRILSCWRVSDPRASNRAPLAKAAICSTWLTTPSRTATLGPDSHECVSIVHLQFGRMLVNRTLFKLDDSFTRYALALFTRYALALLSFQSHCHVVRCS